MCLTTLWVNTGTSDDCLTIYRIFLENRLTFHANVSLGDNCLKYLILLSGKKKQKKKTFQNVVCRIFFQHTDRHFFQAGIDGSSLSLALEPEAASLFCKFLPVEKISGTNRGVTCFRAGSKYLVLDAGGMFINPFMLSGLFVLISLDRSFSSRRGVWLVCISTMFYKNSSF